MRISKKEKKAHAIVSDLAMRVRVAQLMRELGVPVAPETREDRIEQRSKWKRLRALIAPSGQAKLRRLVLTVARSISP